MSKPRSASERYVMYCKRALMPVKSNPSWGGYLRFGVTVRWCGRGGRILSATMRTFLAASATPSILSSIARSSGGALCQTGIAVRSELGLEAPDQRKALFVGEGREEAPKARLGRGRGRYQAKVLKLASPGELEDFLRVGNPSTVCDALSPACLYCSCKLTMIRDWLYRYT